jgi:autotransporter-associated beta strand protein
MRSLESGSRRNLQRAAHIGMVVLGAIALSTAAQAQDATWKAAPLNSNYNNPSNWNPDNVPTGTATFATSSITSLTFASVATTVGGWTFNAGASNYTFSLSSPNSLTFNGAGILINGGSAALNNSGGTIAFNNASSAGSAQFTNQNSAVMRFGTLGGTDTANADTAIILNRNQGTAEFFGHTSAANAQISNGFGGVGGGGTVFRDQSTAANANIQNFIGATTFGISGGTDTASAGNAFISNQNNSHTDFFAHTTAGNAFIGADLHSRVTFSDSSTGGNAQFSISGVFDMSALTDGGMTAGSIEGSGTFFLGGNTLTVGSNNLSTTVSGNISDGGLSSTATGGALVKVGSGTLTLTGINTYTGNTTVNDGMLEVDGSIARSRLTTVNDNATLLGTGTVGNLQVNNGGNVRSGRVCHDRHVHDGAGQLSLPARSALSGAGRSDRVHLRHGDRPGRARRRRRRHVRQRALHHQTIRHPARRLDQRHVR